MGKKITPLMTKGMLTAKLESNDDVLLWLKKTPEAFKRKLLISLLRNAAKPMAAKAKSNVSSMATRSDSPTDDLRDSIGIRTYRKINNDYVGIGIKPAIKKSVLKRSAKDDDKKKPSVLQYAVGVEWGMFKGSFSGYGYMRKAFEATKTQCVADFLGKSKKIIKRTQKRYLRQGRYSAF